MLAPERQRHAAHRLISLLKAIPCETRENRDSGTQPVHVLVLLSQTTVGLLRLSGFDCALTHRGLAILLASDVCCDCSPTPCWTGVMRKLTDVPPELADDADNSETM